MLRRAVLTQLLLLSLTGLSSAALATQATIDRSAASNDQEICSTPEAEPPLRIAACSRLIEATQDARALSDFYNNRATALSSAGDRRRALDDYGKAIHLNSGTVVPYTNRGELHLFADEYDAALADFAVALKLKPDFERAYMGRTLALLRKNLPRQALRSADDMVQHLPSSPVAAEMKAYALKTIGRRDEAITQYRKALRMAHNLLELREEIEGVLKELGAPP